MILRSVTAFVLLALAASAGTEPALADLTAAEQSQLQHNLRLGALLYRYDQSAWHVTDAALAAMPDAINSNGRGYITTTAPNGLRTTFFGLNGTAPYPIYSAVWTGSRIEAEQRYPEGQQASLGAEELRLIEARRVALAAGSSLAMCSEARPNAIVVPDVDDPATVHVYVMTPQTKNDVYPLGGHHRIDVRDGKVIAQRAFTKSCVTFDRSTMPARGRPEGFMITHLLDPVPTEIHAFSVFGVGLPLYVGVKDGRIYAVELKGGEPQARLIQRKK